MSDAPRLTFFRCLTFLFVFSVNQAPSKNKKAEV